MTDRQPTIVDVSEIAAQRIKELRQRGGWSSAKAFAERCAEVGAPQFTEAVLMNIESGRPKGGRRTRTITVDELIALAVALKVSPLVLLLPGEQIDDYPVTPTTHADADRVYRWLVGRARWPGAESGDAPDVDPWQAEEEDAAMRWVLRQYLPYITDNLEKLMAKVDNQHHMIRADIVLVLHELLEMRNQLASGSSINEDLMSHLLARLSESVKEEDLVHALLHRARGIAKGGPGGASDDQENPGR